MTGDDRIRFTVLLAVSAALAVLELFYLPLRFDGALLPDLGGFPFPITVVLAILTMPPLVRRASRLSSRLAVASGPLAIWLACIVVSALPGPGGDVVLVPDWRALLLLAGGSLAGAVTLGGRVGRTDGRTDHR
jgi:hypothetical protein